MTFYRGVGPIYITKCMKTCIKACMKEKAMKDSALEVVEEMLELHLVLKSGIMHLLTSLINDECDVRPSKHEVLKIIDETLIYKRREGRMGGW